MSKALLKDLPGGQAFVESCTRAVSDMALAFAGEPDDRVRAHLEGRRQSFESNLATPLGEETAAAIVSAIIDVVIGRKHKLEAMGRGSA
jgi:hypothetical protein